MEAYLLEGGVLESRRPMEAYLLEGGILESQRPHDGVGIVM